MPTVERILDRNPCPTLRHYRESGGGRALEAARAVEPEAIIDAVTRSGLRGRGGGGYPTGTKWTSVLAESGGAQPPVIVNGAEGEPGSFKDRTLLRRNPYRVLEGALVGARVLGSTEIVVALKASFGTELDRVGRAIDEMERAGLTGGVNVSILLGPSHYLFGEETGLLEVLAGRPPFPRVTPPYRRGLGGVGQDASAVALTTGPGTDGAASALVNNVETWANVPGIVADGPDWFRSLGDPDTPGTLVCTVTGDTVVHGVAEFPSGTTLAEVIDTIGGGPADGRAFVAALSGVANPIIPAAAFDTPLTHGAMNAAGTGLGTGGFILFDDRTDLVAVTRGVSEFLAVESCGQCEPCKRDGLVVSETLRQIVDGPDTDLRPVLQDRLATITDGARCYLAQQHQDVVSSLLRLVPDLKTSRGGQPPTSVAPLVDIRHGSALHDPAQALKKPDWSWGGTDSGRWPRHEAGTLSAVDGPPSDLPAQAPDTASGRGAAGPAPRPPETTVVDDPFRPLRQGHADLATLLDRARRLPPDERRPVIDDLDRVLRHHRNITERVLYPMVRRFAGDPGDDAALVAERRASRAIEVVAGDLSWDDEHLDRLRREVDEHVAADIDLIVPMLEATLDPDALSNLGQALQEAALTTPEPR